MSLTPNYNTKSLSPRVELYDYNGDLQYSYEAELTQSLPPKLSIDFDNRAIDLIGNNNATWVGTEQYNTGGKQEKAAEFDGSTWLTLPNEDDFDRDKDEPFSVSFRIYIPDSPAAIDTIFAKTNDWVGATDSGWGVGTNQNSANRFFLRICDGTNRISVRTSDLTRNAWHTIIFTKGTGVTEAALNAYVDGVVDETFDITGTLSGTTLNARTPTVGAESDGGRPLDNTIRMEHLRYYDFQLSQAQVTEITNSNSPYGFVSTSTNSAAPSKGIAISNLISYHRFEGNMDDSQGIHHGVLSSGGTEQYTIGKFKQAFDFNGSTHIEPSEVVSYDKERTQPFSISLWMKGTNTGTSEVLAYKRSGVNNVGYGVHINTSENIVFEMESSIESLNRQFTGSSPRDGSWHHIVVTYDGSSTLGGLSVWVDNTEATGAGGSLTETIRNTDPFTIGALPNGTLSFTGQIDDIRFFDKKLSASEVSQLFTEVRSDFDLTALSIHHGLNGDYGHCNMMINDRDNIFTKGTLKKDSNLGRQWSIKVYLGKDAGNLNRWFWGKIFDVEIQRPQTGNQEVLLSCVGWGSILRERITRIERYQAKQSDGETVDDTDTSTRIDNLVTDIFTDLDHQIDEDIPQLSNIQRSQLCTSCLDIKIPNVNEVANSYAGFISRMATISSTTWGVDVDRDLFMRDPETHDSGILITNDLNGLDAQGWDSNKIGYISNQPISWNDSTADTKYSWIHSYGSFSPKLTDSDGGTPDASDNLDTAWHAIPFTPTEDTIFKIAFRLIKTGTPPTSHFIEIVGNDGGSPAGPNRNDIRVSIKLTKEFLQNLGTSVPAPWTEISVKPKLEVTPGEQLFIIFPKYGDASNTVNVNYQSGVGNFWDSSGGASWTQRVGQTAFRIYSARRVIISLEDTTVAQKLSEPRERLFPVRADLESDTIRRALINASNVLGKEKRAYSDIMVTPITDKIPLGKFLRLQDVKTGLNTNANIVGVDVSMASGTESQMGANRIKLQLDEFIQ